MTAAELRPLVLKLPRAELLELAHDIQEAIDGEEPSGPADLEKWKLEELERRMELHRQNPADVYTWEEVVRHARETHAAAKQP